MALVSAVRTRSEACVGITDVAGSSASHLVFLSVDFNEIPVAAVHVPRNFQADSPLNMQRMLVMLVCFILFGST